MEIEGDRLRDRPGQQVAHGDQVGRAGAEFPAGEDEQRHDGRGEQN